MLGSRDTEPKPDNWERAVLEKVALAAITEQRRSRRWGIFFKLAFLLYLFLILILMIGGAQRSNLPVGPHTALVNMNGIISDDSYASADTIVTGLRAAFEEKKSQAVILRANSPGGSPVQAAYIYDEIRRLRQEYPNKPIYAVISDLCASACYYVAAATDRIYANPGSVVGSIGVLFDGFGLVETIDKLGIERRLLTAGEHKGILDPFSPLQEDDKQHMQTVLNQIHQQFIDAVKQGRGERLADDPTLYTGLFWTGEHGQKLGLVDDFASAGQVARDVVGAEQIVDYTPAQDFFTRLSRELGGAMVRVFQEQAVKLR